VRHSVKAAEVTFPRIPPASRLLPPADDQLDQASKGLGNIALPAFGNIGASLDKEVRASSAPGACVSNRSLLISVYCLASL